MTGSHSARPLVLVAEQDGEAAKQIALALDRWGLRAELFQDGVEALLGIHRRQPVAAIVGGHLPRMSAPALCELVRRTSELSPVKLIRIAPIDEPAGAPEFEADRIVEPGELRHGIEGALDALGLGTRPAPESSAQPKPPAPSAATPPRSTDPQIAAAERLARIIVSDIVLYNQEKFEQAARSGNVAVALEAELTEASSLFKQRIPEAVRAQRDFLIEELERRAKR